MYMRLQRNKLAREMKEQEAKERVARRKELLIAGLAMGIVIAILGWNAPELLSNWNYREYIAVYK